MHSDLDSILSTSTQLAEKLYTIAFTTSLVAAMPRWILSSQLLRNLRRSCTPSHSLPLWLRLCRVGNRSEITSRFRFSGFPGATGSASARPSMGTLAEPVAHKYEVGNLFRACSLGRDPEQSERFRRAGGWGLASSPRLFLAFADRGLEAR